MATKGPQTLTLNFDSDESSTLTASMVTLKNLTNGDDISVSSPTFSNGGTTAVFTFDTYLDVGGTSHSVVGDNGIANWLPNGYYRVKLSAADLPSIGQDFSSTFFFFAGDANNDGILNGDDYFAIDSHINDPSASGYTEGDFNLDGHINGDDYFILDSKINSQPPAVADFVGDVPEEEMANVPVDTSYTVPAVTADGTLRQAQIAPPEDTGAPYVRGVDYDGQLNSDGTVTFTFNRPGPYIVQAIRTDGGSSSTDLAAVTAGGDWNSLLVKTFGLGVPIPKPSGDLILIDGADDLALNADRHVIGSGNYQNINSVDDVIEDVQNTWIEHDFDPIKLEVISHGNNGAFALGGGENPGSGQLIFYPGSTPNDDYTALVNGLQGKVSEIDFYCCQVAAVPDGALLLQHIAQDTNAIVTGYTKNVDVAWFPIIGGSYYVVKGGVRSTFFP